MRALYDPARHEPLAGREWSAAGARDAIAAICRDAESAFDRDRLWPLHPGDDEPGTPADGILRGLYVGAGNGFAFLALLARTGDVGAALLAAACPRGDAAFPGIDDHQRPASWSVATTARDHPNAHRPALPGTLTDNGGRAGYAAPRTESLGRGHETTVEGPRGACAAAMAMSSSAALAHDPDELGTPLSHPFGQNFWFFANFQTAQNPFNAANKHVTSSDIAFWGDLAYVGDYGGFRIFDISQPTPKLVSDMRCYGPQGDPSVFDRDKDGDADTLVLSVDSVLAGSQCGAAPAVKQSNGKYLPDAWEGLRVFDISNPAAPRQIAAVYQDCGSHTNTLLPAKGGKSMYVLNSSYPLGDGPTCGPLGAEQGRKVNHGVVQVIEVPFKDPAAAREVTELPIVYPGDADGTYKPVSEHGISAPLDDFLGCHDLSSFPDKGIVGAACGEQAQVWNIDRKTGLPDTANPRWAYDQPNVDFWHSATFSWDGKIANFIDESFGDRCPTVTTKTGGLPGGKRQFETGNMYFFETKSGALLSEYRNPRPTNDNLSPEEPGRLEYCSSHLGIPVPAKDRYLLVNAYYRGGSSVIDFSDPTAPKEIAFADKEGTNTWSAYTYPRVSGRQSSIPVYSNDGLSRNYARTTTPPSPAEYREAAYGFMRFRAEVGRTKLVGFDRLNPQLQERVIATKIASQKPGRGDDDDDDARRYTFGTPAPDGARIRSARPFEK